MDTTALFKIGYGLYVLSARENGRDNGCIINSLMQVSSGVEPTLVLGVNKLNYTRDMIAQTGLCNISVLSEAADFEVFRRYGFSSGRDTDKIGDSDNIARSENGLIYLPRMTNSYMSLRVLDSYDFDTHTLFKAALTDAKILSDTPSMTYAYYHANVKPKPAPTKVKGWRCKICGYVYEGETLPPDFVCPLCKHPASDFEPVN